jgi:hypothetical protein
MTLARFRLRPVPWAGLTLLAGAWMLLARLVATAPAKPEIGVTAFRMAALLLGLAGALLAAPETDPPRDLLRSAPRARWRALALRLAGWLALGAPAVLGAAAWLAGTAGWSGADLARAALPDFLLMTAACFLGAGPTSALGGGVAGLAAVAALAAAGRAWPARFPVQLGSLPGEPAWATSRAWMVGFAVAMAATALLLEARAGTRFAWPGRRRLIGARPATEGRAGP